MGRKRYRKRERLVGDVINENIAIRINNMCKRYSCCYRFTYYGRVIKQRRAAGNIENRFQLQVPRLDYANHIPVKVFLQQEYRESMDGWQECQCNPCCTGHKQAAIHHWQSRSNRRYCSSICYTKWPDTKTDRKSER